MCVWSLLYPGSQGGDMKHDGGGSGGRQATDSVLYLDDLVLMGTPLGCIITLYSHFLPIPLVTENL